MSLQPSGTTEDQVAPQPRATGLRLPLGRPVVTYVLLGVLVIIFIADYFVFKDSRGYRLIFGFGAQANEYVGAGQYWRLLTSVFLHANPTHLLFNAYALYILGRDTESLYGSLWFTVLYFLAGLAGSLAWYDFGDPAPSLGASGAIFGLIGAEAAFFVRNRGLFGSYAGQRLKNIAILLVINLVLTFAIPNINIFAHVGGLTAGFLLGLVFSPAYTVAWAQELSGYAPRLIDTRTSGQRWLVAVGAVLILLVLLVIGNQRWAG